MLIKVEAAAAQRVEITLLVEMFAAGSWTSASAR